VVVSCLENLGLNLVGDDLFFYRVFLHLFRSFLTRAEFPPLAPEIPGWPDIPPLGPEFPPPWPEFPPLC
jgi:hypothetical protein